jgi:hypothetical protein
MKLDYHVGTMNSRVQINLHHHEAGENTASWIRLNALERERYRQMIGLTTTSPSGALFGKPNASQDQNCGKSPPIGK